MYRVPGVAVGKGILSSTPSGAHGLRPSILQRRQTGKVIPRIELGGN